MTPVGPRSLFTSDTCLLSLPSPVASYFSLTLSHLAELPLPQAPPDLEVTQSPAPLFLHAAGAATAAEGTTRHALAAPPVCLAFVLQIVVSRVQCKANFSASTSIFHFLCYFY